MTSQQTIREKLIRSCGRLAWSVSALAFALIALAPQARAQETSSWLVVTTEGAPLRSGDAEAWYEVARLERGQALRTDGRRVDWHVVHFPQGIPALVPAAEVETIRGGEAVRLIEPSRLRVWNVSGDPLDAFRALMTPALPSGTELTVMRTVDRDGAPGWRLVEPPAGARAYVHDRFVRPATEEEARRFSGVQQEQPAPEPRAEAQEEDEAPANIAPTRETTPEPVDMEGSPFDRPRQAAPRSNREMTTNRLAQEDGGQRTTENDAQATADGDNAPFDREIGTFRQLESAFRDVVEQPILEAELEQLTAEFRRLLRSIGQREEDVSLRAAVESRVELLKIRSQLQEDMRRLSELEATASESASEIARRVESLKRNNVTFDAVGRLATSSIYNGKRLPLMYRLQSVDAAGGRTIAYVAPGPEDELDLAGRIGAIVGVIGESRTDPALRMDIIRPARVDTLTTATYRSADAMDESEVDAISR